MALEAFAIEFTKLVAMEDLGRVVNYCNSTRNASPDFEDG